MDKYNFNLVTTYQNSLKTCGNDDIYKTEFLKAYGFTKYPDDNSIEIITTNIYNCVKDIPIINSLLDDIFNKKIIFLTDKSMCFQFLWSYDTFYAIHNALVNYNKHNRFLEDDIVLLREIINNIM